MDTTRLQRHFADCELPLRLVETDPRPHSRRQEGTTFTRADDFFFVDIITQQRRQQFFRLFTDDRAAVHVMDKKPTARHLLLQVRCWPVNAAKEESRHLLLGHDERQLFIVRSSGVSSVQDALAALKPAEVATAERRGLKVIRQGDWFFIPVYNFKVTPNMIVHRSERIGGPNAHRWGIQVGHPHVAEEQALMFGLGRVWVYGRWEEAGQQLNAVYVRGKVRHEEHATVELRAWHRAIQNVGGEPTPAIGYFD